MRPWQHVLVPLSGYLTLTAKMQEERKSFADAWNFGPLENKEITSKKIAEKMIKLWGSGKWVSAFNENEKKETKLLRLSWEKALHELNWKPAYNWENAIESTVEWFKEYELQKNNNLPDLYNLCLKQIKDYTEKSKSLETEGIN